MTDSAIENAIAIRAEMADKIAKAEEQIKEWRSKMDRVERFIRDWEDFSGEKAPASGGDQYIDFMSRTKARIAKHEASAAKSKNPKKEDVAEEAIKIIRENGKPMTRDQLFEALQAKGITIFGKNPPVVLQTMLWRMQDRIVHLKGHGYWPREDDYMAADYIDGSEPDKDEDADLSPDAKSLI